jgi:PAS domain S-box-containing protein
MGVATGNSHLTKSLIAFDESAASKQQVAIDEEQNCSRLVRDHAQSSDYLPHLARATNDAVRDWDVRSGQLAWHHGLQSLFGYNSQPAEQGINFWEAQLHPSDQSRIAASIRDIFASASQQWSGEYRFRCRDGRYLQILERAFIVRDADKKPVRFIGSMMDITARKQLHDQLSRSQKMEAFGQLAGAVAHDFNNFLTSILGYSDLVLMETVGKGAVASHVNEIRKAAGRASTLASQLISFSRKQALDPDVVEVNSIITNLERTLLPLLGENISVACNLHRDKKGAYVRVDAGEITQVIINLALNGRDAMPKGGQLTLETVTSKLSEDRPLLGGDVLSAGEYVVINVIDNGTGMTDEAKAHLFEPFFTTKPHDRNSGLGLPTSYGIVCQSGGRIRIESEMGKGTTVQLYLPKVPAPPPPSYRKPSNKRLPAGTESIMVIEDDVSVRHISVRVLRNLGYEVVEAASCVDAQRLFAERSDRKIHLLLTDMVMPQMSGRDFAEWLQTISPETKVLFVSGYLEDSIDPPDRIGAGTFFLSKPFDPEQLATAIRNALDSP